MDLKLCIKNITNLVVETVSELDLLVKNYSEKIKEMVGACMHACVGWQVHACVRWQVHGWHVSALVSFS